ncbi:MAG: PEGA domain-containing protein [Deltaproteobacteria bacterium]|nr:PEGA domain-containing protein [Deltaproteobacteria bacterium]
MRHFSYLIIFLSFHLYHGNSNAQKTSPKPQVSSHFFIEGKSSDAILKFKSSMEGALGYSEIIEWKQVSLSMPLPASDQLLEGAAFYKAGKKAGKAGDLQSAYDNFSKAMEVYEKNHYALAMEGKKGKKKFRNTLKNLAAFSYFLNDKTAAEKYLLKYLAWKPKADEKSFPDQMATFVKKVREGFLEKGRGKLVVTTEPPGATIYYKTKMKGAAPVTFKSAPHGNVVIVATLPGYEVAVEDFSIDAKTGKTLHIVMKPNKTGILNSLINSRMELSHKSAGKNILDSCRKAKVDMMVYMIMKVAGTNSVEVTAFLFDSRLSSKLNEIKKTFDAVNSTPEEQRHFIKRLFTGVPLNGKWPKKKKKPGALSVMFSSLKKIPQSRYFWPAVGGIGGVIVAGTITAIIIATSGSEYYPRTGAKLLR